MSYSVGNQYKSAGNSKGTGAKGKPTAIALKGKKKTMAAVVDPSSGKVKQS